MLAALALQIAQANADRIPRYEVFELTFGGEAAVHLQAPSGRRVEIGAFPYAEQEWRARFAPDEPGEWQYSWQVGEATGSGSFTCIDGHRPGFVRRHPTNPHRWVFDDGTPYYPIGLQECVGDNRHLGTYLAGMSLEGPFRMDRDGFPDPPPGPMFQPGPSTNPVNGDVYFRRYARAGFNLFRFSQQNCSPPLYADLDRYDLDEARKVDELLRHAQKYGFRIFYGIFGYQRVSNDRPQDAETMEKVRRFVKYTVDRWGAYVDFWEFLNEQHAADGWYAEMIPYLRSIDPYGHPVTTSWERPGLDGIDVNAPHWYEREDERQSDRVTADRAESWRAHGKPVIVGEQGNMSSRERRVSGIGGVWDDRSALRMRLRIWSAFFHEIAFIFWNTSYAKDGHFMNLWIGPLERQYVRALQDFAYALGPDLAIVPVRVSAEGVRAYGLASSARAGVYLHHFARHDEPVRGVRVTIDVPATANGFWYSPETGAVLGTFRARQGEQTFDAPEFTVDLALLIGAEPLHAGSDDDGDGVPDERDVWPLEAEEWEDRDGDWIGDNLDADDDGDGLGDDADRDGTPDCEEMDLDGDGVPRAHAVPWDAFPFDAREWRDTDGDGTGDNADPDDDGDGATDEEEERAGTDPRDPLRFPG